MSPSRGTGLGEEADLLSGHHPEETAASSEEIPAPAEFREPESTLTSSEGRLDSLPNQPEEKRREEEDLEEEDGVEYIDNLREPCSPTPSVSYSSLSAVYVCMCGGGAFSKSQFVKKPEGRPSGEKVVFIHLANPLFSPYSWTKWVPPPRDEDVAQIGRKRIRKAAKREILLCDYDGCGKIFSNRQYLNYNWKMSLQYIKSQKGRNQLLYKGYLHKKERKSGDKILWKCANYPKYPCTGRAHTCHGRVIKYVPHIHPPSNREEETDTCVREAKETTSSQESVPKATVANGDALPGVVTNKKPRIQNNPQQTIQRLRARLNATRQRISDTRAPAALAGTTAEGPPVPSPLTSGLQEPSAKDGDRDSASIPILGTKGEASHLAFTYASQEAGRQRFRSGAASPGETPLAILSQLTGGGRDGFHKVPAPDQETPAQVMELSEIHEETFPQSSEPSCPGRENCLDRQQKNSSGGREVKDIIVGKDLRELDGDAVHLHAELGVQPWCICSDCEKPCQSLTFCDNQESPSKDDLKSVVVTEELYEIFNNNTNSQNSEGKNKEGQNHTGNEEVCVLLRNPVLQDSELAEHGCTDDVEKVESLTLVNNNNNSISGGEGPGFVIPPEESQQIWKEGISQSHGQDTLHDPVCIVPVLTSPQLSGTEELTCGNQNILVSHGGNSSGDNAEPKELLLLGNSMEEPGREILHPCTEPVLKPQCTCANCGSQWESSEHTGCQKSVHGEDLYLCPKCERQFTQNSDSVTQHCCSGSEGNSVSLSTPIKRRKRIKKGNYFKGRSKHMKCIFGARQRICPRRKIWKFWRGWSFYRSSGCRPLELGKAPREHNMLKPVARILSHCLRLQRQPKCPLNLLQILKP
ncbi:hypothetical protein JRQ81_003360 [Phrynocephalus forsythii]|uniref:FLYWCH-type domain-containing protein n=1 Tax=Phrynocephalus forsythii TaxID=171643 RepID=A0A9Q0XLW8_9SAUR|nr:hypothetical protein JRQ81_003360 [Phrynocephalus forsythii]